MESTPRAMLVRRASRQGGCSSLAGPVLRLQVLFGLLCLGFLALVAVAKGDYATISHRYVYDHAQFLSPDAFVAALVFTRFFPAHLVQEPN